MDYDQAHYCMIGIPTNCHRQLQETQHASLPFITAAPDTDSAGPHDIKLLNQSGPVFVDRFNSFVVVVVSTVASDSV